MGGGQRRESRGIDRVVKIEHREKDSAERDSAGRKVVREGCREQRAGEKTWNGIALRGRGLAKGEMRGAGLILS